MSWSRNHSECVVCGKTNSKPFAEPVIWPSIAARLCLLETLNVGQSYWSAVVGVYATIVVLAAKL